MVAGASREILFGLFVADVHLLHLFPKPKWKESNHIKPELPVFFGHYCLLQKPQANGQTVHLDGCVTCDKKLCI